MAALKKAQGHDLGVKTKNSTGTKRARGSGGRRKRSSQVCQQSLEQQEPVELEGIQYRSHAYTEEDQHVPERSFTLTRGPYEPGYERVEHTRSVGQLQETQIRPDPKSDIP